MTHTAPAPLPASGTTAPDPRRWRALGLLAAAQFMLILDITVVSVALPDIQSDLQLGQAAVTWVMTAYTVVFGGLMLLGGRGADLYGGRRLVLSGLAIFTAASLVAGVAGSAEALVGARIGQGIGAAMLSPAALAVLTSLFHGAERTRALAVWGALGGTGVAVGVLAGGVLTSTVGWRSVFLINLPVGLAVLLLLPGVLPRTPAPVSARRLDLTGALIGTLATASAIYGLVNIGAEGLLATRTLVALTAGAVLYVAFVAAERTVRHPLVPPRLLTARPLMAGSFLMLVGTGLLVGGFFLGSFALQVERGFSALETGLLFLPIALTTIVGAHVSGELLGRTSPRVVAGVMLAAAALGYGLVTVWGSTAGVVIGTSIAAGAVGATFVAASTGALATVDQDEAGASSGLLSTFHELGSAFGVAVLTAVAGIGATGVATDLDLGYATAAGAALVAGLVALVVVPPTRLPAGTRVAMH